MVFEGNRSYNFYMTISGLNGINFVCQKDSLIVFFLNACK